MKLVFKGNTLPEIFALMEQTLASVAPADEEDGPVDGNPAGTSPAAAEPKPKRQSKAAQAKAKDLAEKAAAAGDAQPPGAPAPVGASGANGTPAVPDGRMQRPMCAKHAEAVDKKKFNVLEVDSSRCIQCLQEKTGAAPAPAPAAPAAPAGPSAEDVKNAFKAVMAKFPAVSETEDPGSDKVYALLQKYGAETVTAEGYKQLDPQHYAAVIAEANALITPVAVRPKL